jgi:hypothetical protein
MYNINFTALVFKGPLIILLTEQFERVQIAYFAAGLTKEVLLTKIKGSNVHVAWYDVDENKLIPLSAGTQFLN